MTSRSLYRRHSTPFKLQLCKDIRAGGIGRRDAQRTHQIPANLIHLRLTQFDRGERTNEEAEASVIADVVQPFPIFTEQVHNTRTLHSALGYRTPEEFTPLPDLPRDFSSTVD